jgi:hypothetical protein
LICLSWREKNQHQSDISCGLNAALRAAAKQTSSLAFLKCFCLVYGLGKKQ